MIRTACFAATLAASVLLPVVSASAAVNLNGQISQIVNALQNQATFDRGSFTFSLKTPAGQTQLFQGLGGVQSFNNYGLLNDWVAANSRPSIFNGGSYSFTHSVLGSYFGGAAPSPAPKSVFEGGSYKFTHSVLDSYFDESESYASAAALRGLPTEPQPMPKALAPIPEPASWAMMIGGMALAGAMLRRRRRPSAFA